MLLVMVGGIIHDRSFPSLWTDPVPPPAPLSGPNETLLMGPTQTWSHTHTKTKKKSCKKKKKQIYTVIKGNALNSIYAACTLRKTKKERKKSSYIA